MSQPFNQQATCPAAGDLNTELGEFWLENPWQPSEHNLSAYERNRVLLNSASGTYIDVSHLSGGADLDSDSRAVVAGDFDEDGRLDLLVRSSGGGPVQFFRNSTPPTNWVRLTLRGVDSNSQGIGARVRYDVNGNSYHRLVQAPNGFLGQSSARLHLGLGDAETVEQIVIDWPSGVQQVIRDLAKNKHWVIFENKPQAVEFQRP
ncbi:CRTAC1 family protein [Planctomicrobium sp.]|nr:CRTAC1 family protein [Planctomicrobium sp.]MBT5018504.1 CRTAC1 family protein [Planctomicrobium sp.]MDA7504011.1 CRTAC1 family protein [bacterium]MDA7527991.1 CRTAC1 family protein [bacterium]MDB4743647.1 CRTAC1 family protein [Planctomicrobium sp.]